LLDVLRGTNQYGEADPSNTNAAFGAIKREERYPQGKFGEPIAVI